MITGFGITLTLSYCTIAVGAEEIDLHEDYAVASPRAERETNRFSEETTMTAEQFVYRIQEKDWTIIEQLGPLNPSLESSLIPLLTNDDSEVRELSVHVLDRIQGPQTIQQLLKAIEDNASIVRAASIRLLSNHMVPSLLPPLLQQLQQNKDEYVREQSALLIGRIGDVTAVEPLKAQYAVEVDQNAKQALSLALAKLANQEHRTAYINRLGSGTPAEIGDALKDLQYLADRSLVPQVQLLIDDGRDAHQVGPSHAHYYIRVCDMAINALSTLLSQPFPFELGEFKRYSTDELLQAKQLMVGVH